MRRATNQYVAGAPTQGHDFYATRHAIRVAALKAERANLLRMAELQQHPEHAAELRRRAEHVTRFLVLEGEEVAG